ncbi:GAP family protein [Kitasatospora purpeofusca]|uniref:GAP family protein n=1 Tax=Kitasatospora purpeofusca TaxID=67352 RepID=UPI00224E601A|nr:GAP family protein [Kitasatospora purpeofusca]MCX4757221.1 GAP family protein [Kitasatospora purpeofusca]WSR35024.1 GAP family protein [Kitasatospora purpeofusca]
MAQGIGEVLTFAIGVAISPVPIIAVILMLFSHRAKVNGPMFLAGWVVALGAVSSIVYLVSDAGDASTDSTAADGVSWAQIVFGVLLLLLAGRSWRNRPAPGSEPRMPPWMAGIDAFTPGKAFGLGVLLAGVNPKNLLLAAGAGSALAVVGPSTTEAVVSLIVFVVVGSLTIAGPVLFHLTGGDRAKASLDLAKGWLSVHNDAVMTVLFLVFGVNLIAKGIPPLT